LNVKVFDVDVKAVPASVKVPFNVIADDPPEKSPPSREAFEDPMVIELAPWLIVPV
jgi:hypothetical protein